MRSSLRRFRRFAQQPLPCEWKQPSSYDRPADLPDRLRGRLHAGKPAEVPCPVAEIADLALEVLPTRGSSPWPPPVEVDGTGVDAVVRVHDESVRGVHPAMRALLHGLRQHPGSRSQPRSRQGLGDPIAAGRMEFHMGHLLLASLWGGGTPRRSGGAAACLDRWSFLWGRAGGSTRVPLSAGRRLPGQPTDPQVPGLRRAGHDDTLRAPGSSAAAVPVTGPDLHPEVIVLTLCRRPDPAATWLTTPAPCPPPQTTCPRARILALLDTIGTGFVANKCP